MSHSSYTTDTFGPADRSLRVLHLVKGLGPGGAERLIVNQLLTSDGEIDYFVARIVRQKHQLVSDVEATGAHTSVIGGGRLWPLRVRRTINGVGPDIVHAHSPVLAGVVRVLRATRRIDALVVTTEHNRWPRHHRLTRAFNRHTARFDDARIAVSHDVRASMQKGFRGSTKVIDHGVPLDDVRQQRTHRAEMRARLLGDDADTLTAIGIVANFRPEKAYDVFLDAVRVATTDRSDLRFIVVGQGPGEEQFRSTVSAAGLGAVVDVLGYRDDPTRVMSAFDVFTLSSRHEGKPVSLMEALALGIPAVCTRAGGIPEVITHGHDGLLVDVGDASALAAAWLSLVDDDALRASMSQAASASATRFDAAVATRSIESLYRSILG